MKRRDFLFAAAMLAPAMRQASAQQPAPKKRLAVIGAAKVEDMRIGREPNSSTFLEELQRLGYVEGGNLIVDRWQLQPGRLEEIAREVVDTRPDVIACQGTPMTLRLKAATTTIPIVAATGDPIRFGLVSNLARPGGNVTGVSVDAGIEVWAKRLELLSSAVPKLHNVVFVSSEGAWTGAGGQAVRDAAQKLGISLVRGIVSSPYGEAEFRSAFSSLQRDQLDGLILSDEGQVHVPRKPLLVQLIQQMRLPAIYPYTVFVEAGGLMSYASDVESVIHRQVAQIVEIFRGANPGDIPYSQAVRFDLVVNLKTAKELGLEMPAALVAAATTVIE
ncbi:ABC transporter substrate-binding protein [Bradyrhizobium manausense]|uniref:ABC transporter substrate-binding protein n=1 Tax=Bradyrhizobium TaxID=374 RepID=UPI001BAC129B|nr:MULTISPECIES: ABC transporter substrate-binding protein [Bradyrhizobium]MBR0828505.1 ABC transporter substrate-binding protein [Bradyrhizobium manausense]UVO32638.1 ABC transporter substrate-binding protein [Bradyrhizobium arachidis]